MCVFVCLDRTLYSWLTSVLVGWCFIEALFFNNFVCCIIFILGSSIVRRARSIYTLYMQRHRLPFFSFSVHLRLCDFLTATTTATTTTIKFLLHTSITRCTLPFCLYAMPVARVCAIPICSPRLDGNFFDDIFICCCLVVWFFLFVFIDFDPKTYTYKCLLIRLHNIVHEP